MKRRSLLESVLASLVVLAAAWAGLRFLRLGDAPDAAYLLHNYAYQLARGAGLVFNPGERVLLLTAPLTAALEAALARFLMVDVVTAGEVLFALALAAGAGSLFRLLRREETNWPGATLAALAYGAAWPLWLGVGGPRLFWLP